MNIHISFVPEKLFEIGGYAVSNSLFTAIVVTILFVIGAVVIRSKLNTFKPGNLEIIVEIFYTTLKDISDNILGTKASNTFIGFLLTFFVFILFSNWLPLLPVVSSVGIVETGKEYEKHADSNQSILNPLIVNAETIEKATSYTLESSTIPASYNQEVTSSNTLESSTNYSDTDNHAETNKEAEKHEALTINCLIDSSCYLTSSGLTEGEFVPLFRAPTADLSFTVVLALISVIVTNLIGFAYNKLGYIGKYFSFKGPIEFIVGILELISEIGKIISFAFRLFGNIFAGEVLLAVITSISFGIATLPFFGLELFVGFIQAFIFFMLTAVFIGLAKDHHH